MSTATASIFLNAGTAGRPGRRAARGIAMCPVAGSGRRCPAVDGPAADASLIVGVGGGVPARAVALTGVAALGRDHHALDVSIEGRWVRPGSRKGFHS